LGTFIFDLKEKDISKNLNNLARPLKIHHLKIEVTVKMRQKVPEARRLNEKVLGIPIEWMMILTSSIANRLG